MKGVSPGKKRCAPGALTVALLLAFSDQSAVASSPSNTQPAIDTVVEAFAGRVVQLRYFGGGDDLLGAAGAPVTGLLLEGGWVLTSTYGLEETPAEILCRTDDGQRRQAQLVARDLGRCIALLRLDGGVDLPPELPPAAMPAVGQTVIALGRVYNADSVSVNVGVVSAVGRLSGRATQTDAQVSPVNYGGPLLTLDGVLVGVLAPLSPPGQRGVDLYDSGVGFATTSAAVEAVLPALARGIDVRPGSLGVRLVADDPLRSPAKLLAVTASGPAATAGLKADDVVIALAGAETPSVWALRRIAQGLDAGQTVEIVVRRGDKELRRDITLWETPQESDPQQQNVLDMLPQEKKKPGEPE